MGKFNLFIWVDIYKESKRKRQTINRREENKSRRRERGMGEKGGKMDD